jgi:hypothetical protein
MASHVRVLRVTQGEKAWLEMSFQKDNQVGKSSMSCETPIPPNQSDVTMFEGFVRQMASDATEGGVLVNDLRLALAQYR